MKTIPMIQYVERFDNLQSANDCLAALSRLMGFVAGRAHYSPSFREKDFVTQAFFNREDDVNPESIASCLGLRCVLVPASLLVSLGKVS